MGGILFRALIFILAVSAAGIAMAAEQPPAAKSIDTPLQKENLRQIRNEREKLFEKLQRFDEKTQSRFERIDKSIQDGPNFRDLGNLEKIIEVQNSRIDRFLSFAGWYAIILMVAIAGLGFTTYISARKRAEDAVREEAKDAAEMWLENNEDKILKHLTKKTESISSEAIHGIKVRVQEAKDEQEAITLFNKGVVLGNLDRPEDAIAVYDEVVNRYGDEEDKAFKEMVAKSLVNKGVALGELEQLENEIAVYDEVVSRYGDNEDKALKERVARALFNKGVALDKLDRPEDEIAVYDEVISRYGDEEDKALKELVAKAFNGKAFIKLNEAKKVWQAAGKNDEARKLLSKSLSEIEQALEIVPDDPMYLGNKGYALFLLGKKDDAEPVLRRALEIGGEALRDAELEDADIHPLPRDKEFKALIGKLWEEVKSKKESGPDELRK